MVSTIKKELLPAKSLILWWTADLYDVGHDSDLYQRSEIPVPIPSVAERQEQPSEFDVLQHHAKALDDTLINMADVVDMTDEFATPRRKPGAITPSRWPIGRPAPIGCCRRL